MINHTVHSMLYADYIAFPHSEEDVEDQYMLWKLKEECKRCGLRINFKRAENMYAYWERYIWDKYRWEKRKK